MLIKISKITIFFILNGFIAACTTASIQFEQNAQKLGFRQQIVQGTPFRHTLFLNKSPKKEKPSSILHVYLGGDGTPWIQNRYPAIDPTPRQSIMLKLMQMDNVESLYLGRPCYHQTNETQNSNCRRALWTEKRYAKIVIESMAMALQSYLQKRHQPKLVLLGFSGGGTLAMLLAPYFPETIAVVTLAGNLDIEAWTQHHHYSPLTGSLNPAKQKILASSIQQIHLWGENDQNIRDWMIKPVIKRQKRAKFIAIPNANHHCCWDQQWLNVLKKINTTNRLGSY